MKTSGVLGILGLGEPTVYLEPLTERGLVCETFPLALQADLDGAFLDLMAVQVDDATTAVAGEGV